jgi:hypothetical protein
MRLPGHDVGRHFRKEAGPGREPAAPRAYGNGNGAAAAAGNGDGHHPQSLHQRHWLVRATASRPRHPSQPCAAALASYRQAVAELLFEVAAKLRPGDLGETEALLADRLGSPEFTPMLAAGPGGQAAAIGELLAEVRRYRPKGCTNGSYAADLATMIRVHLLARVDAMWWGRALPFATDAELTGSRDLVDLEDLRRDGTVRFKYRLQARTLATRAVRAADRRLRPDRLPRTAGLRSAYARPEVVALLNQLSARFDQVAPPGTPPLWVTSLSRSVEQQSRLRALGYKATPSSSHCVGYATDIEMAWFRRFGAHRILARLLLERQDTGELNVIDEGQVWHVCVSPAATAGLRRHFHAETAG